MSSAAPSSSSDSTSSRASEPESDNQQWAVVGGGMLGLTLAYRLAASGRQVTLLEAAPRLGGLVSTWELGDVEWEKFYHVILLSDSRLRNLLSEIGLEDQLRWVETKTGFYTGGQLYSMSNTAEFLSFPPLNLIEKLRLGGTIFYASKIRNWRRLERLSVANWLRRWSGKTTFEKIWLPLLRAKLGESYKDTAASFIWAHINRMYAARRTGLKKEMFGYVPGGYRTIVARLEEKLADLGVTVMCGCQTEGVERDEDGRLRVTTSQGRRVFDRVIVTTPNSVAKNLCPELSEDENARLRATKYLGICCASLLLKKPLSPYYVTNLTDDWVPMTAVIELTNIVDPVEFGGHSLVYLPKYVPADHPLFECSDEEIQSEFLSALQRMYPSFSPSDVAHFGIARTRSVMAIPTLNYSQSLPPMRTSVPGLFLVNSSYILKGNLNVNETIAIAEDALEQVVLGEQARI